MTTTTDRRQDPRSAARPADLQAAAGRVRARRRHAPVRRPRPLVPRLRLGHRRRVARPRASGAGARRSANRRRRSRTRRTSTSTRCRANWRRGSSALSGLDRAFFCNSGTEAIEACLKFARRYWHTQGETTPDEVRGVHALVPRPHDGLAVGHVGRTLPRAVRSRSFPACRSSRPPIPASLAGLVDDTTAAIIVEPIQGEGGVRPISAEMARAIAEACAAHGHAAHRRRSAVRLRAARASSCGARRSA